MASSTPQRLFASRSIRLDEASHKRSTASDLDLSVTRLEYAMMNEGSPNREHVSIRQASPPNSMNRKIFMDKLLTLSKLHVDEAGIPEGRPNVFASSIPISMDTSVASALDETDVSSASTHSILQRPDAEPEKPPVDKTPNQTMSGGSIKYLMDFVDRTARHFECIGSCTTIPVKCDDFKMTAPKCTFRDNNNTLDASNLSRSTYDGDYDTDDFGDSFDDTFDDTLDETFGDQDTYTTATVHLNDYDEMVKASKFDDTTTISSQNSAWL